MNQTDPSPSSRVPQVYREFAAFLRRPVLPAERLPQTRAWWRDVALLVALDFAVSLVLIVPLSYLSKRLGIAEPDFGMITQYGFAVTLLAGAFAIPALEEFLFRFWLDGRPRSWLAVAAPLVAVVLIAVVVVALHPPKPVQIAVIAALIIAALGAIAWRLRRPGTMSPWFARHFAWFYYASALAFAAAHLGNYPLSSVLTALPMVTPQLVAGLILGFARVRFGYGAGLLIHGIVNGLAFALVFSGVGGP